jgi:hypothetical protein
VQKKQQMSIHGKSKAKTSHIKNLKSQKKNKRAGKKSH